MEKVSIFFNTFIKKQNEKQNQKQNEKSFYF
jgi:hypothetical protein